MLRSSKSWKPGKHITMTFSEEIIQKVWEKGKIAKNNNPNIYRKDECGAWIKRDQYSMTGETLSYGWSIDYIIPLSKGGNNDLSNLRPLQWENHCSIDNGKHGRKIISEGVINRYEYYVVSRQMQQ
jgi:hypothetical protein